MNVTLPLASIYILIDPRDEEIRYVGLTTQGIKKRLKQHLIEKRHHGHYTHWMGKLRRLGLSPRIEVVQEVPREWVAQAEVYWISHFRDRGCRLVNGTDGGEGTFGWKPTEETKDKIRQKSLLKMQDPARREAVSKVHKGKKISVEHRALLSAATTKRWVEWRANGSYTRPETRAKLSAIATGRPKSDETRRRLSVAIRGHPKNPSHKANLAAHLKRYWKANPLTPEQRERMSAAKRGRPQNPESIRKRIASMQRTKAIKREALCQSST